MSEKLKINVEIAGRFYPLTVLPEQEEVVNKVCKKINTMITQFEQNYEVKDKQDLLAMCVIQYATQVELNKLELTKSVSETTNKLENINNLLNEHLYLK